jgi:hypothetical protein
MNKIRTYSCLLLTHVFILFAAVQYNDPDPYIWIPVYMLMAILCVVSIFRTLNMVFLFILFISYTSGSIYLFPEHFQGITMPMNDRIPAIEEARESLGLLICAFSNLWLLFLSYNRRVVTSLQ